MRLGWGLQGAAVLDGFTEVRERNVFAFVEVGNGTGNAQYAVEAAGAPAELGGCFLQEL